MQYFMKKMLMYLTVWAWSDRFHVLLYKCNILSRTHSAFNMTHILKWKLMKWFEIRAWYFPWRVIDVIGHHFRLPQTASIKSKNSVFYISFPQIICFTCRAKMIGWLLAVDWLPRVALCIKWHWYYCCVCVQIFVRVMSRIFWKHALSRLALLSGVLEINLLF